MTYKLPPLPTFEEWCRIISPSEPGTQIASVENFVKAYAIAAIEAHGVPDKTGTAYADLHTKWRKVRQELANLTRAHERLKAQGVPDGWQLVPKQPTHEMERAGWKELPWVGAASGDGGLALTRLVYAKMLASAPPAPQAEPAGACATCGALQDDQIIKQASVVQQEPFGCVTVVRKLGHADTYYFYPHPQPPYLDNASECHTVYTHPAQQAKPQPLSDEQKDAVLSDVVDMLSKQHDWLTRTSAINLVAGLYGRAGSVLAHGITKE